LPFARVCRGSHITAHREESAAEIVKSLYQNFQQFTEGATQLDDLTIVVVKVGG
jgi:serine phosphatase RsbU (regulator of sigma subunit)